MGVHHDRSEALTDSPQSGDGRRRNRLRAATWGAAGILLLLPLVAMAFTDEVNWDLTDFVVFGALLTGAGLAYEFAVRRTGNTAYRTAVGVALAGGVLLVWVNGAVGVIGDAQNDANLMYFGVLGVGIVGALIARFRPRGMARALLATALAQALVAGIALVAVLGDQGEILIMNSFFVALFAGSAWLFRQAARARESR